MGRGHFDSNWGSLKNLAGRVGAGGGDTVSTRRRMGSHLTQCRGHSKAAGAKKAWGNVTVYAAEECRLAGQIHLFFIPTNMSDREKKEEQDQGALELTFQNLLETPV